MLNPQEREAHVKQVYLDLDRKFEEEETQRKAFANSLSYINLYGFPVDSGSLSLIDKETAESLGVVIFFKEGRNLKIGILSPSQAVGGLVKDFESRSFYTEVFQISESSFKHALLGYEKLIKTKKRTEEIRLKSQKEKLTTLKDLAKRLATITASELIDTIMLNALELDASDIHIEPEAGAVKLRYRIDGVLQDVGNISKDNHHQLVSRIKILSKLKLNITAVPQDGSFSLTYNNLPVDIRVSVLPSTFGESIVLRILRQDKEALQFEELGITGLAFDSLLKELEKPNGMIATTGPTGSGKTTTLYAILNRLNEPGVKIITLEDPVEYKIPGITQTPIDAAAGLTFASGLRAILRQDPDIVMVGEMRDFETAETASQAALTGHIVLSTLHTNDAAGAIPRLIDLGVKPFVLAPAINAIIAQRLVRRICTHCKQQYEPVAHLVKRVQMILASIPKNAKLEIPKTLTFHHSPGCAECKGLGYKGRIGIYEIFTINEVMEKLILKGATTTEIKNQAVADGMVTMAQDGILKALAGITDVEEVFRVTEE